MKKWIALFVALAVFVAPLAFGADDVEAKKSYRSSKKSFNSNVTPDKSNSTNSSNMNSNLNSSKTTGTKTTTNTTRTGGGFLSGLMFGGLAGFLFGSMFDGLGAFGALLGLMVNGLAILALIGIVMAAFTYIKNSRNRESANPWKRS